MLQKPNYTNQPIIHVEIRALADAIREIRVVSTILETCYNDVTRMLQKRCVVPVIHVKVRPLANAVGKVRISDEPASETNHVIVTILWVVTRLLQGCYGSVTQV
jgi:hypothetical protein